MVKTFLRSGNLDAVLALGENGQPVYASALQIRETLRLRRQTALADCLAIPQANEKGDRLDWYAPFSGKVKSWLRASEYERRHALETLTAHQQELAVLCARARDAENPAMRLFAALLAKSLQFPGPHYVYLIDGKPVITFWGFTDIQSGSQDDALACLRESCEEQQPALLPEMPVMMAEPAAEPEMVVTEPAPAAEIVPAHSSPSTSPADTIEPAHRSRFRLWYLLAPSAVIASVAIAVWLNKPQPTTLPEAGLSVEPAAPPSALVVAQKLAKTMPQAPASVAVSTEAALPSATLVSVETPPVPAVPPQSDALILRIDDVRAGAVGVVDGNWRVVMKNTLPGGASPLLRFELKGGKGQATVTQGNNVRCIADEVSAAMLSSGQLSIRSRYTAKCSDGSRYRMPQLMCKPGDGAAVCSALFSDNKAFPMTIKRESK